MRQRDRLRGLQSILGAPSAASNATKDPAEIPRAWWRANEDKTRYTGFEQSVELVRDVLAKDHYEGVFGFSQGAAFASFITALLEKPHLHPPFLIDGKPPHPPLKFCVAVSGFLPLDVRLNAIYEEPFNTYTLHVLGTNDVIVSSQRSHMLIDMSANRRVEEHDGGHFVPSKTSWRNFFRDFLRDPSPTAGIPSPSAYSAVDSEPVTRTGTPRIEPQFGENKL